MTQPSLRSDLHEMHPNELRQLFVGLDERISRLLSKSEKSGLSDGERRQLDELDAEATQVTDLIVTKERSKPKTGPIKPMATTVQVGNEEHTYRPDSRESYFRDLALAQVRGDFDARDRLHRHKEEIETTQPEFRDINRTDTTGGEFVPPIWLIDDYAGALRAGRTTANLLTQRQLPGGTDSINIPKISTGGSVDPQTADNAAVSETDPVSTTLTGPVRTLAGQVDLSLQLLEQSPASGGMDSIIYADLLSAYNAKLNTQVLNGSGGSGQITGILQTSGIIDVDYTDGSPTVAEVFSGQYLLKAKSQSERQRFANLEAVVMHPRRWNWFLAGIDSSNRPYILPSGYGPQNAQGVMVAANAEGLVGNLAGLPVYSDPGIPTTLGGGTEDVILLGRFSDGMLFESSVRTRLLLEPLSGQLTARAQLYRYVAFIVRYPLAFATVSDTGFAASGVSGF